MIRSCMITVVTLAGLAAAASAQIRITEAYPSGSGNGAYAADWFELTNTGPTAVDITGWRVDDNSNMFANAVAIRGITSIPAGSSVVFFEGNATGTTDATISAAFLSAWFGSSVPSGFLIGSYGGSGIGFGTGGDAVNIYDASGVLIHNVSFGATVAGRTLDNGSGASGAISQLSIVGVNNAFLSDNGSETGSPGIIPAPGAAALLGLGGLLAARRRRA